MPEKHAKYPPSGSYLWLNCPHAYTIISKLPPEGDSEASKEGTRLHEVMERFLHKRTFNFFSSKNKPTYTGFLKAVQGQLKNPPLARGRISSNLFKCMVSLHNLISKDLEGLTGKKNFALTYYEEKVTIESVLKNCWGTADLTVITPKRIYTIDYKFGRVPVRPDTPQLILYSIGNYRNHVLPREKHFPGLDEVCNVIIQPQLYSEPKTYIMPLDPDANIQLNSAVMAIPGAAWGTIILQIMPRVLAPSTLADSSIDVGIPSTIPFNSQMAKGRLNRQ